MSDHLDGLTAASDPRLDISDVYIFRGKTGTVLVMNTNPGGTEFHHEAVYEFHLDMNADAREDLTFRVVFGEPDEDGRQRAELTAHLGSAASNRDAGGVRLARTITGRPTTGLGGVRFWAGLAGDPFYIAGPVVTAVRTAVVGGARLDLGDFDPERAENLFAGGTVQGIVIEVPDHYIGGHRIGFWGSIAVPTDAGDAWRQTDRAANPLVSTLFGFNEGDDYQSTHPADDDARWGEQIQQKVSRALTANGYDGDAQAYAARLRDILMPDILPYRIGTEARFVDGCRNGRNLTENTPEEMFQLLLGRQVDMGLDADSATGTVRPVFPYVSEPVPPRAT